MDNSSTRTESSDIVQVGPPARGSAMEALSRRFRGPLVRFFQKRIGRHAEVDDLVQEVFLHLVSNGKIDSLEQPEGYLFRTAVNVLNDRQRRRIARVVESHESYDEAAHGANRETPGPDRVVMSAQAIEELVAALYELPARAREVWALYHLENLSHAEIAARLGVTISMIEKHMGRATARLLKRLSHSL